MTTALLLGSGALADVLAKDIGALGVAVRRHDALDARFDEVAHGAALVVDARRGRAARDGIDGARRAIRAGADWIDLARGRERVLAIAQLDQEAREAGRAVLSGCGMFPGLVEPFVRARLADLKRVNEVLIGLALGPGAAWDAADFEDLLDGHGRPIPMLIGGEATQREFWGDRRWFEHPAPTGRRRSANVDAPDLALYIEKPYRSASARLSVSLASRAGERGMGFVSWLAKRGLAKDPARHAARLARLAGGRAGAKGAPTSLTFTVRGMDAKSLPFERRISYQTTGPAVDLEVLPALVAARALLGLAGPGKPRSVGARPAVDLVDDVPLASFATERGVRVRRGDLGGWHS